MCGIAGSIGNVDGNQVRKMSLALAHRGPDDQGFFEDDGICLSSRRLSIIDLSSGKQPIYSEDGSICVVFNGEIYNYKHLRSVLESIDHSFSTKTDTEVIVHGFEEYGEDFVKQLCGEFAFALYDSVSQTLFLYRDRFGVKPLYYAFDGAGTLFFASEIKGVLAAGFLNPELGYTELSGYFKPYGNYSPIKGIKQVLPGTFLKVKKSTPSLLTETRYYEIKPKRMEGVENEISYLLNQRFSKIVDEMSESEAPLGALLSGGLDSSIICSILSRKIDSLPTFCVGSVGANEFDYANKTAAFLNTDHHSIDLSEEQVIQSIPQVVYDLESLDSSFLRTAIPMHRVLSEAKKEVKVVLCGEGADELFAGYQDIFIPIYQQRGSLALQAELQSAAVSLFQRHLLRLDRVSMANSIEGRVPFMDHRVVEFALGIDPELKVKGMVEKSILRKSFADALPTEIINRSKCRFGVGAGIEEILKRQLGKDLQKSVEKIFEELFIHGKKPENIDVE